MKINTNINQQIEIYRNNVLQRYKNISDITFLVKKYMTYIFSYESRIETSTAIFRYCIF